MDPLISDPEQRLRAITANGSRINVPKTSYSLKSFMRSAEQILRQAKIYFDNNDLEFALTYFTRYATLHLEKLQDHPDYKQLTRAEIHDTQRNLKLVLDQAEMIKTLLRHKFELEAEKYREEQQMLSIEKLSPSLNPQVFSNSINFPTDNEYRNDAIVPRTSIAKPEYAINTIFYPNIDDNAVPNVPSRELKPIVTQKNSQPEVNRSLKLSVPIFTDDYANLSCFQTLREVLIPADLTEKFLRLAEQNTLKNKETCGILCGELVHRFSPKFEFHIAHVIIPKQTGTADSCTTEKEEEVFDIQDNRNLVTIGWIHTHPTQTAFLSSVDLHTHCSYQLMLPEAIAIVCSPKFNETGVFTLTDDRGLHEISNCRTTGFHPHSQDPPLFERMSSAKRLRQIAEHHSAEFHLGDIGGNENDGFLAPTPVPVSKTRGAKRKNVDQQVNTGMKKNRSEGTSMVKLIPSKNYPNISEHPFNRDGYRYFLAEIDIHAPNRQEFDESSDTVGKPIPSYMYRLFRPSIMSLSPNDRAPQLKLHEDRMQVTGDKGYSVIRATHGVSRGAWFYEVNFSDQPDTSHVRIGYSQSLACLQAPVGYDKFSYAWRSRKGTVFNDSNGKHFCTGGYKQGDVVGFYIFLPDTTPVVDTKSKTKTSDHTVSTNKDLPLIKFKSYFYYEEKDEVQQALKNLKVLKGSKIVLYKNGVNIGVAFNDLYRGTYYPAVSLYKNATVRVNFGPTFEFPPKDLAFEPMSCRAEELVVEQVISDMLFFIENEGKLTLDARQD